MPGTVATVGVTAGAEVAALGVLAGADSAWHATKHAASMATITATETTKRNIATAYTFLLAKWQRFGFTTPTQREVAQTASGCNTVTMLKRLLLCSASAALFLFGRTNASMAGTPTTAQVQPVAPATVAPKPPAWHWKANAASPAKVSIKAGRNRCTFNYNDKTRSTVLQCVGANGKRIWGYDQLETFVDYAALVADENTLYVVRYCGIATGAFVTAYDLRKGTERWQQRVLGIGPVTHSGYRNEVQVELNSGTLRVFGQESSGRYVEDFATNNGERLGNFRGGIDAHSTFTASQLPAATAPTPPPQPGAADGVAFEFSGPWPDNTDGMGVKNALGLVCQQTVRATQHLDCSSLKGKTMWQIDFANNEHDGASIAATDITLFVVRYPRFSSGGEVFAYNIHTGATRWRTVLHALGSVEHSEYLNDISLRIEAIKKPDGSKTEVVVASGHESNGKYVEVLDAKSGADLGNRRE